MTATRIGFGSDHLDEGRGITPMKLILGVIVAFGLSFLASMILGVHPAAAATVCTAGSGNNYTVDVGTGTPATAIVGDTITFGGTSIMGANGCPATFTS